MDLHSDDRYLTRDLPRIKEQGLWYPILVYPVKPNWWSENYENWRNKDNPHIFEPVVIGNLIFAIKIGNNRYQCAKHLGYDSMDAIFLTTAIECVKLAKWFVQCEPLNNVDAVPYMDLLDYTDVLKDWK